MSTRHVARRRHAVLRMRPARAAIAIALLAATTAAYATDGYFTHGYGIKAQGRGGAAIAFTDDAFGGANNPATVAFAGDRLDLGISAFSPRRTATRSGLGPGLDGTSESGSNLFGIPEFGYTHKMNDQLALGITVYGNGGMNTNYPGGAFNCGMGPSNMLCGMGRLGVNLEQLMIAPTLAYAFTPRQSIGITPVFGYQIFSATGLQAFMQPGFSVASDKITNNHHDTSSGFGVRVGYYAQITDEFSVGVTWASKMQMSRFSKYAGLFAGGGKFDIPANYGIGAAWTPAPGFKLGLDYVRINYADVPSVGDSSMQQAQLGSANGPGFGWKNINVVKVGAEWASSDRWTWRIGYNRTDNPVSPANVTFNILAPGVVTDHLTLGFTRTFESGGALSAAYMHAFKKSVSGASILPAFMGGMPAGNETISMYENSLGVQYEWKFR